MRAGSFAALLSAGVLALGWSGPASAQAPPEDPPPPLSVALGKPWNGRLVHGLQLPEAGVGYVTYDDVEHRSPNRPWRRWGTQALLDVVRAVAASYAADHPDAPTILVADLSRPQGGPFGKRFGGLGHASHQNGLDVDVMYPRKDRRLTEASRPSEVDQVLAQDLVDRFLEAGAQKLFVGPHLRLTGPRRIVVPLAHHDDHVHVRIPNPATGR